MRIAIQIGYRDRPTELTLLLQSLRTQTYKDFEVFISDDCSGTLIQNYHFLMCIFNKMNEEGNFVHYQRNDFNLGVSKNRQKLVDWVKKTGDFPLYARLDDDIILEPDYLEQLIKGIDKGFDLMSGVTPFIGQSQFKRESKFLNGVGNRVIFDKDGNFIWNGDDFGLEYYDEEIIPIHHFRSCALYKKEIHDKVDYDNRLTKHGFREEQIFSFKCILNGFKLGANTKAVAWHLLTPSGGERFAESNEMVKINEQVMKEWTKEMFKQHGDFIKKHNQENGIKEWMPDSEEIIKQTNLVRIG